MPPGVPATAQSVSGQVDPYMNESRTGTNLVIVTTCKWSSAPHKKHCELCFPDPLPHIVLSSREVNEKYTHGSDSQREGLYPSGLRHTDG